jgi:acylphosphatase
MLRHHYDIRITGKVQGVFFRASARGEALRLGLHGFVRNEEDGAVYAEAEGPKSSLDAFLAWCRQGPPRSRVDAVEAAPGEIREYRGFHVR